MPKLNKGGVKGTEGPLTTSPAQDALTHEDGGGFSRARKAELFLRATTGFAGEKKFYEKGVTHDDRMVELMRELAVMDWEWSSGFLPWLRQKANIRTTAILLACEAVDARLKGNLEGANDQPSAQGAGINITDLPTNRQVIDAVQQRGDEPGELLQYWLNNHGHEGNSPSGKWIPKPVKRGVADATSRMSTQRAVIRYDGLGPMRMADLAELTHPKVRAFPHPVEEDAPPQRDPVQGPLFRYLITDRRGRDQVTPEELVAIRNRQELSKLPPADRHTLAHQMQTGDMTATGKIRSAAAGQWEWVMSWLGEDPKNGKGLSKREQWEIVIPWMGYMALIRNLRNFDEAGIKDSLANKIASRISEPGEVLNGKQLPFRYLTAIKNAPSMRWEATLEAALNHCLPNITELAGRTLILIDLSGSMTAPMSAGRPGQRDTSNRPSMMEAAALFGVALGCRNAGKVDMFGFADEVTPPFFTVKNQSILKMTQKITNQASKVGYGTQMEKAVRQTYNGQDRVCVFTDMQTMGAGYSGYGAGDITQAVPADVHVFGFNLAGYSASAMATGATRHEMGGLTDHTFGLIPLLEAGTKGAWPWEN